MRWMRSELKQEEIKEISVLMLEKLVERGKTMAVVFHDPEAEDDRAVLKDLELIDDDCAKFEINFVKLRDAEAAREYGIDDMPGLLYFENRVAIQQALNFKARPNNGQKIGPKWS